MKLIIDDADVNAIKRLVEYYPVDGVTTNPSILAASGRQPFEVLREIRDIIGPDMELHAQVVARDAEGMVADGKRIVAELGENTFPKVPSVPEGFKAIRMLAAEGIRTTATAIYTPMQAFLAAKAGASYAAPYINRIDNMGYDGVGVAMEIHDIFARRELQELPADPRARPLRRGRRDGRLLRDRGPGQERRDRRRDRRLHRRLRGPRRRRQDDGRPVGAGEKDLGPRGLHAQPGISNIRVSA